MELRPGYKQTEIGVIPADWDSVHLGDIGEALIGLTYRPMDVSESGTLVLRSSNIQDDKLSLLDNVFVDVEIPDRIRIRSGDVLVCVRNGSRELIGKAAFLDRAAEGMTFGAFMAVHRSAYGRLVGFLFQSRILKRQIGEHLGATINQITNKSLNSFLVPLPRDEAEQSAIATALSDVDALLAAQDALIAKKRAIKQGAMQELLTGKRRLPGFGGGWEVRPLRSLLESPVTDGPHLTPAFLDRGIPFLSVNNLIDGKIDWSDLRYISEVDHREFSRKCRPQIGDVLFGKAASVGRVAFVDTSLVFNIWSPIALIRIAQNFSAKFVYRQLQSKFVERQVLLLTNSSSQGNIGMGDIERLDIHLPSSRDEQDAISDALDDMDAEITALEAQRAKTAQLKQGMMQVLLTGQIRLI